MDPHVIAASYLSFSHNLRETIFFLFWPKAYQTLFPGTACVGQIYTQLPWVRAFPLSIPSSHPASLVTFPPIFFKLILPCLKGRLLYLSRVMLGRQQFFCQEICMMQQCPLVIFFPFYRNTAYSNAVVLCVNTCMPSFLYTVRSTCVGSWTLMSDFTSFHVPDQTPQSRLRAQAVYTFPCR